MAAVKNGNWPTGVAPFLDLDWDVEAGVVALADPLVEEADIERSVK